MTLPCGHPDTFAMTSTEGTSYCARCARWQTVEGQLATAESSVTAASRLVPPGIGAAGDDLHQLLLDTAEKIGYVRGVIEDEKLAEVSQ